MSTHHLTGSTAVPTIDEARMQVGAEIVPARSAGDACCCTVTGSMCHTDYLSDARPEPSDLKSCSPCRKLTACGEAAAWCSQKRRHGYLGAEKSFSRRTKNARCARITATLHLRSGEAAPARERAASSFNLARNMGDTACDPVPLYTLT